MQNNTKVNVRNLELEPETNEEPDSKPRPRKWKLKTVGFALLIVAVAITATRPVVTNFASTLKTYLSTGVQGKAWNEAKRQNLERDIKSKSEELEKIKPVSFWIPEAKAAEVEIPKPPERPEINKRVEAWLKSKGSPMTEYTDILMEQKHWKRILSIANAESTLCKRYPTASANCWGIGGENLWDLGDNLGEGIAAANKFLETQPGRSKKKYAEMTIEEMNGLYKQPYGAHWSVNNYTILQELDELENK